MLEVRDGVGGEVGRVRGRRDAGREENVVVVSYTVVSEHKIYYYYSVRLLTRSRHDICV